MEDRKLLIRTYYIAQGTQYSVMACMEKESKRECIYAYTVAWQVHGVAKESDTTYWLNNKDVTF